MLDKVVRARPKASCPPTEQSQNVLSPRALAGYVTEPYSTMPLSHGRSRNTVHVETGVTRVTHYLSPPQQRVGCWPRVREGGSRQHLL